MRRLTGGAAIAVILTLAAGCDSKLGTTTPTTPTVTVTEVFAGSIVSQGRVTFFFNTSAAGFLTATLSTLSPDPALQLGLALGTWNGSACQTLITNERASQGVTVSGNASAAGALCVQISDANGTITTTSQFQIVVVHP